jgi:hypothetical protein
MGDHFLLIKETYGASFFSIHSSSSFFSDIVLFSLVNLHPLTDSFVVVVCMKISELLRNSLIDRPTELPVPLPTHALYIYNVVLLYSVDGWKGVENREKGSLAGSLSSVRNPSLKENCHKLRNKASSPPE